MASPGFGWGRGLAADGSVHFASLEIHHKLRPCLPGLRYHERVDGELPGLTVHCQRKSILQQRLQHEALLLLLRIACRFGLNVKMFGVNPAGSAQYGSPLGRNSFRYALAMRDRTET